MQIYRADSLTYLQLQLAEHTAVLLRRLVMHECSVIATSAQKLALFCSAAQGVGCALLGYAYLMLQCVAECWARLLYCAGCWLRSPWVCMFTQANVTHYNSIYVYIYIKLCTCVHMDISIYTYIYIFIYLYICIYTYI